MYERILVALDGSELAESILPHVEALGRALGSTLVLMRATMPAEKVISGLNPGSVLPSADIVDPMPMIDAERDAVDSYLTTVAERLEAQGLRIHTEEPEGPAADAILQVADDLDADLIAMTTHGRTGMKRLVFGSVAGEVLHRSTRPLLLVRVTDHPE